MMSIARKFSVVVVGVCSVAALCQVPVAGALPPGGASANTAGTSSSVSPTTIEQCGELNFTLKGFPANSTVSVKFDDGKMAGVDTSVQGTGVIGTWKADKDGTVTGKINGDLAINTCALSEGSHWLRFLTTGYSNRTDDFTVTAKGSGTTTPPSDTTTPPSDTTTDNNGSSGWEIPAAIAGVIAAVAAIAGAIVTFAPNILPPALRNLLP